MTQEDRQRIDKKILELVNGCGCCPAGVYGNYIHLTDESIKMLEGVELVYENEGN